MISISNIKRHTSLISILLICILTACATPGPTKPNIPFAGNPSPSVLDDLARNNPLLAEELGKLPELQDGISEAEAQALNILSELYHSDSDVFDKIFAEMYGEGMPGIRKYCSPLQALFWLVEDGKLETCNRILSSYNQDDLLQNAWYYSKKINLSEEQLKAIIDSLPREKQMMYAGVIMRDTNITTTLYLYNDNPEYFSKESKKIIKDAISENTMTEEIYQSRWHNYETVLDRLNSPNLIDNYQHHKFIYFRGSGSRRGYSRDIFKTKTGDCRDYTAFCVACLQRAGYEAKAIKVIGPAAMTAFHVVCEFKDNDKAYIMDNSCLRRCGGGRIQEKQQYVGLLPQVGYGYLHDLDEPPIPTNRIDVRERKPVRKKSKDIIKSSRNQRVVARDHNYVKYSTGVVCDENTGLEWYAGPDEKTRWDKAKSWAANLEVDEGGWRMPTIDELRSLYVDGFGERNMTPLLETTGWGVWSGEKRNMDFPRLFMFSNGKFYWRNRYNWDIARGFAVRSRR